MEPTLSSTAEEPIRLFLLVENRLLRETLLRMFRKRPDFSVVGHGPFTNTVAQQIQESRSDILVLDYYQVMVSRLDQVLRSSQTDGLLAVLIGMEEDEEHFFTAIRYGVVGYLPKDASAGAVVAGIRAVAHGEAVCTPRLCLSLMRWVAARASQTPIPARGLNPGLTTRQQRLLSLVAKGLTNKEIASQLSLSEYTVKNHVHRIMKQLDVSTRHEAAGTIRSYGYALNA